MRKTVELSALVDRANVFFAESANDKVGERKALAAFVGHFLHDCGQYQGFRYLTSEDVTVGLTLGIIYGRNGSDNVYPDDSRISYYLR